MGEQEVSKGKNINTEIYWERSKMEDELKQAKDEVEKLKKEKEKSSSGSGDKNNDQVKSLKDQLAKKEEELQSTKGETAKFQINMKKDLEKIKQMSLAHTSSKEKDSKLIKEHKKEIEQLKKACEEQKVQVQILEQYNRELRKGKNGSGPPLGLPNMTDGNSSGNDSGLQIGNVTSLTPPDSAKKTTPKNVDKNGNTKVAKTFRLKQERIERSTEEEESDTAAPSPKASKTKPVVSSSGEGGFGEFDLPLE